jgi:hypothetical protein
MALNAFSDTFDDAMFDKDHIDTSFFLWAAVLGAAIGLGQILDSGERLSARILIGRALVTAGLAAIAPVLLTWFPAMPRTVEFAFAALIASLGTSGLQMLARRFLNGKAD